MITHSPFLHMPDSFISQYIKNRVGLWPLVYPGFSTENISRFGLKNKGGCPAPREMGQKLEALKASCPDRNTHPYVLRLSLLIEPDSQDSLHRERCP